MFQFCKYCLSGTQVHELFEGKVLKCCVTVLVSSNMKKVKLETFLIFCVFSKIVFVMEIFYQVCIVNDYAETQFRKIKEWKNFTKPFHKGAQLELLTLTKDRISRYTCPLQIRFLSTILEFQVKSLIFDSTRYISKKWFPGKKCYEPLKLL